MAKPKPDYNLYDDFDDFIKTVQFSSGQWKCFENYVNPESETCNDRLKSYLAAGYRNNSQTIYRVNQLFATDKFKKLLYLWRKKRQNTIEARQESAIEFVCRKLRVVIQEAEGKGDLTNLNSAIMNYAKVQGLLADRVIHETDNPLQLDSSIQPKAIEEAQRMLLNPAAEPIQADETDNDIIEAEFEDNQEEYQGDILSDEGK
ncbi:MAG: hypothetical protein PHN44_08655 [Candidatus Marinimicrobia bacterium]|nr:hypothetical protein [Candidatus Neomarinimicrobiota bacterium]